MLICCLNGNASAVNPDIQPPSRWPTRRRHAHGLVPDVPDHLRGVSTATKFRQNVNIILRIMTFCNKWAAAALADRVGSQAHVGARRIEAVRARRVPRTNTLDAHLPSTTPASAVPDPPREIEHFGRGVQLRASARPPGISSATDGRRRNQFSPSRRDEILDPRQVRPSLSRSRFQGSVQRSGEV